MIKKNFTILPDNDIVYFQHLEGILSSSDELAATEVVKNPKSYTFRIVPSLPKYSQTILKQLLDFHNLLGIRMNISKSIRKTSIIQYEIEI